jgi:hypothetical protein
MKQQRSTMQHVRDVTGTQEPAPATASYETATFNDATCTLKDLNLDTRSCTSKA